MRLTGLFIVQQGVGVHGEQSLAEELVGAVGEVDECDARGDVLLEGYELLVGVVLSMGGRAGEQVGGGVVRGEEAVVAVYLAVDAARQFREELVLVLYVSQFLYPLIDGSSRLVVDVSLLPRDARLHVREVVLLRLLPCGVVPLLLELLRLQVVAWVVFIADAERHNVQ